jgi:hypothetical protein
MYDARVRRGFANGLASAFLAGDWEQQALIARAGAVLEPLPSWVAQVTAEVISAYPRPPLDRRRELSRFIDLLIGNLSAGESRGAETDPDERIDPDAETEPLAAATDYQPPQLRRWLTAPQEMARRPWPVPAIASLGELAEFLGVSDPQLAWLADVRGLERTVESERLRNYHYGTIERPGRPPRVIERPKPRLKAIQRRILHEVLTWIPVHEAAQAFLPGRSVLSHAAIHSHKAVVVRIDLEDFFGSIAAGRVYGIFRSAGYPEAVAHALAGLTTNVVPGGFWASLPRPAGAAQITAHHRLGRRLATPHLPQGTPTSPALANLAAFALDRRLSGLSSAIGADYTRYADDLTFSGPIGLARSATRLRTAVAAIAADEGFRVNDAKSTLATRAGRQRVCGLIVNAHPNVAREEYDLLRATLHNAALRGPASQNREAMDDFRAHLLGRISWVAAVNPSRGHKLRRQFAAITWQHPQPD